MIKIDVKEFGNPTPELEKLYAKCNKPVRLMKRLGKTGEVQFRKHFSIINKRPNKRGWRKQNFYSRIRNATAFTGATDKSATITISDPAYAAKIYGATITPKGGKKYLAIPANAKRYGTSPSSANDWQRLFFLKTSFGRPVLAMANRDKIEIQYFLVRRVYVPRDPEALPDRRIFMNALVQTAKNYVEKEQ